MEDARCTLGIELTLVEGRRGAWAGTHDIVEALGDQIAPYFIAGGGFIADDRLFLPALLLGEKVFADQGEGRPSEPHGPAPELPGWIALPFDAEGGDHIAVITPRAAEGGPIFGIEGLGEGSGFSGGGGDQFRGTGPAPRDHRGHVAVHTGDAGEAEEDGAEGHGHEEDAPSLCPGRAQGCEECGNQQCGERGQHIDQEENGERAAEDHGQGRSEGDETEPREPLTQGHGVGEEPPRDQAEGSQQWGDADAHVGPEGRRAGLREIEHEDKLHR